MYTVQGGILQADLVSVLERGGEEAKKEKIVFVYYYTISIVYDYYTYYPSVYRSSDLYYE